MLNRLSFLVLPLMERERITLTIMVTFRLRVLLISVPNLLGALKWESRVQKPVIRQLKELQHGRLRRVTTRRALHFSLVIPGSIPRWNLLKAFIPLLLVVTLTRYLHTRGRRSPLGVPPIYLQGPIGL